MMRAMIFTISLTLLPFISSNSQEVITDPVVHLLNPLKATEWCELWRVETDLNADGKKEVFLALSKWSNAKAGFYWHVYLPVEGGYKVIDDTIDFRKEAFLLGKSDVFGNAALITYVAGGGGLGSLIAYQLWNDRIKETILHIKPAREDKEFYEDLQAKGTPIKIERKSLSEYADKGLIRIIPADMAKQSIPVAGEAGFLVRRLLNDKTRDSTVDDILKDRKYLIERLIELLEPVNADKYDEKSRASAVYLLGEFRAVEAVSVLAKAFTKELGPTIISEPDRFDVPFFTALVKIGRPAVPALIKNIEESDNDMLIRNSTDVLLHILGGKRRLLELLSKLEKQAADDEKKLARIKSVIKYAEEQYKESEEPLY